MPVQGGGQTQVALLRGDILICMPFIVPIIIIVGLKFGELEWRDAIIGGILWLLMLPLLAKGIEARYIGGIVMIGDAFWLLAKSIGGPFPTMRAPRRAPGSW